ncbi:amidohydrolase family protein [Pseudoalteromonas fenneropenaei]|uniref:Amidohydrolase family protein n=1 Tax=Pseudoalteromonas fenneropenaei TaxID=1737459 RepID=A0ABV7CM11_9GAMM
MTIRTPIIDPHLHLFDLAKGNYHWLKGDNPPTWPHLERIRKNHSAVELLQALPHLAGFVHIEAGFDNDSPERELAWLAEHVTELPYKAIAYACISAAPERFAEQLAQLQQAPNLVGIRDITEGEDGLRLSAAATQQNLALLAKHQLIFEAQANFAHPSYRDAICQLAVQLPDLTLVLCHAGLLSAMDDWQEILSSFAPYANILVKFSGQEMLAKPLAIQPAFQVLLDTLGAKRIMLASNYPVCLQQWQYDELWLRYKQYWPDPHSWNSVSYQNAADLYGLKV